MFWWESKISIILLLLLLLIKDMKCDGKSVLLGKNNESPSSSHDIDLRNAYDSLEKILSNPKKPIESFQKSSLDSNHRSKRSVRGGSINLRRKRLKQQKPVLDKGIEKVKNQLASLRKEFEDNPQSLIKKRELGDRDWQKPAYASIASSEDKGHNNYLANLLFNSKGQMPVPLDSILNEGHL